MTTAQYEGILTHVDANGNETQMYPEVKTDTTLSVSGKAADAAAVGEIKSTLTQLLTSGITAGDTSVTITDDRIKSTSIIDIYFEDKVLAPTNVTVSDGSITIDISEQDTDTNVGVRVL